MIQKEERGIDMKKLEKRIRMTPFNDIYSKNIDSVEVGKALTTVSKNIEKSISENADITNDISQLEKIMIESMGGQLIDTGDKRNKRAKGKISDNGPKKNIWLNS